jgi:branched-chain amino acid transport system substrate-binding protein
MERINEKKGKKAVDRRTFLKVAGAAGAATLVGGFPYVVRAKPKEVLIGQIHPLTGGLAQTGNGLKTGMVLAAEEINRAGGIKSLGGAKFKIIHGDSQGKPEIGVSEAERLIKEGVVATFGCYQSSVTFAVTQIHEKYKTPFLITLAISEKILERGFKYTFRTSCDSIISVREIIDLIPKFAKEMGTEVKTIATIYEDTLFGVTMSSNAKKHAPSVGLELVAEIPYNWKTKDLSPEVTKLKAAKPDVIVPTGYLPDTILLARTMKELKCNAKGVIGTVSGGLSNPIFSREAGDAAEYMMNGINWPNPVNPRTIDLAKRFLKRTGNKMSEDGGYGYMPVYVLKDALERAGTTDRKAVRDAIAETRLADHILPQAKPIVFDKTGQNTNAGIVYTQVKKGDIYSVYPPRYAQRKPIFPVPRWEDRG